MLPEKIIADCGGAPTMRALFSGVDRDGDPFSQVLFASGGMGAAPHKDGLPTTAFPTNVGAGSIEAYESVAPLLVWKKRLRTDSGGPGTFRGGLGQVVEIEVRTEQPVRLHCCLTAINILRMAYAEACMAGRPMITLDNGDKPHPKSRTSVDAGRRVTLLYAGGGGYGDPRSRSREAVKSDLLDGYISALAAKRDYGLE